MKDHQRKESRKSPILQQKKVLLQLFLNSTVQQVYGKKKTVFSLQFVGKNSLMLSMIPGPFNERNGIV